MHLEIKPGFKLKIKTFSSKNSRKGWNCGFPFTLRIRASRWLDIYVYTVPCNKESMPHGNVVLGG